MLVMIYDPDDFVEWSKITKFVNNRSFPLNNRVYCHHHIGMRFITTISHWKQETCFEKYEWFVTCQKTIGGCLNDVIRDPMAIIHTRFEKSSAKKAIYEEIYSTSKHTEAKSKWLPFDRRHFQTYFFKWKLLYFGSNIIEVWFLRVQLILSQH